MKLMIVDDSNVMRRKIKRAVEQINIFDVVVAENGVKALEVYQAEDPDIITMDVTMPEMDGLECIQKLMEINPEALILVVSALTKKEVTIEAMRLGAKGFINKPFDDDQLTNSIQQMQSDFLDGALVNVG